MYVTTPDVPNLSCLAAMMQSLRPYLIYLVLTLMPSSYQMQRYTKCKETEIKLIQWKNPSN